MRAIAAVALVVVAITRVSAAQPVPYLGLYSDAATFVFCDLDDDFMGLCPLYVVQSYAPGLASRFKVDNTHGFTAIPVNTIVHTPAWTGDPYEDISLEYGGCLSPPVLLMTLVFFCQGTTPDCAYLFVAPGSSGEMWVTDCGGVQQTPGSFYFIVNETLACPCGQPVPPPSPVEATTWGQIKALYE